MSDATPEPEAIATHVLDAVTAGLWPTLSTADRREKALRALGLNPCGEWPTNGRRVYIEAREG